MPRVERSSKQKSRRTTIKGSAAFYISKNDMPTNNLYTQITHRLMDSPQSESIRWNHGNKGIANESGQLQTASSTNKLAKGEAQAMARILIEDVLGRNFTKVMAGIDKPLEESEKRLLDECVKRIKAGEPVQYVVGSTLFCGCKINVDKNVLIPRPETEELADIVIEMAKKKKGQLRIMDACTGSGCLAIAIKKALPDSIVCACDISDSALALAKQNAEQNNCEIRFFHADLLAENFPNDGKTSEKDDCEIPDGEYDIIVSNPPYVMEKEKAEMEKRVLDYEPSLALFVEDGNPLVFYKALAHWSETALASGGLLACEINAALPVETANCFLDSNFHAITVRNDFLNNPRFLIVQK